MTQAMTVPNARTRLQLHTLQEATGPSLLLLHALKGASVDWPAQVTRWPGSVFALDLAGHGQSDRLKGGGYAPELFAADADSALAVLGEHAAEVRIAGAGIGAYAGLLLAGARPDVVKACLMLPGEGFDGGPTEPDFESRPTIWGPLPEDGGPGTPDPALERTGNEFRPLDYVLSFARRASKVWLSQDGSEKPVWWHRLLEEPNVETTGPDLETSLRDLGG